MVCGIQGCAKEKGSYGGNGVSKLNLVQQKILCGGKSMFHHSRQGGTKTS